MTREFDEKRDFLRIDVNCQLTFKVADSEQEEYGEAVNLSGRGMLFISERVLEKDSVVEVKINPENNLTPTLHAQVKVVRVEKQRRGTGFEIGAVIKEMLD